MSGDDAATRRFPLSPTQSGMLLRSLMQRDRAVNVEQLVLRLGTRLDHALLQRAWRHMTAIEPIFRTAMNWRVAGGPYQEVAAEVASEVDLIELADGGEAEILRLCRECRNTRFDLATAPLTRWLHIVADGRSTLVWTLHHILFDGRSYALLLDALFGAYRHIGAGRTPQARPQRPFREFVASLATPAPAAASEYWLPVLAGYAPPPSLCRTDVSAPAAEEGDLVAVKRLNIVDTRALVQWSERHGVTLANTLHGLWCLVLSILTGARDIVFGVTLAGRHVNGQVFDGPGLYINTLPLRWRGDADRAFADTVVALREQILALRPFAQTPLTDILRWAGVAPGRHLFETLVVYDHQSLETRLNTAHPFLCGCRVEEYGSTGFPLTLAAFGSPALELRVIGDPACLSPAGVARASELLGQLARVLPRDPPRSVGEWIGEWSGECSSGEWGSRCAPARLGPGPIE